ncbi:MAG: hypothetical protein ACI4JA_07040 [Oscillospiraceae bacterium]
MKKSIIIAAIVCLALTSCGSTDSSVSDDLSSSEQIVETSSSAAADTDNESSQTDTDVSEPDVSETDEITDITFSEDEIEKYLEAFNKFMPGEENTDEVAQMLENGETKYRFTMVRISYDKNVQKHKTHSVFLAGFAENMMSYVEENYQPVFEDGWDFKNEEPVETGEVPDIRKDYDPNNYRRVWITTEWSGVHFDTSTESAQHPACFTLDLWHFDDGTNVIYISGRIVGTVNAERYYIISDEDYSLIADAVAGLYLNCEE